jgi:hypothetical protein
MALMVVRVRGVDGGSVLMKRSRMVREVRAYGGRWMWMCVTKGEVMYATKKMGTMPQRTTDVY